MQNHSDNLKLYSQLIDRCQKSGKTVEQFCKEENIGSHRYYYWRKKVKKSSHSQFIHLNPPQPVVTAPKPAYCEVLFANGNRILFHQPPTADLVKQLMS
jgi:transposase-like protein